MTGDIQRPNIMQLDDNDDDVGDDMISLFPVYGGSMTCDVQRPNVNAMNVDKLGGGKLNPSGSNVDDINE